MVLAKSLTYTFRTNAFKDDLFGINNELFVFGKLKEDLNNFCSKILNGSPDLIIGVAKSDSYSRFESIAINRFNKTKKIIRGGDPFFELFIPSNTEFNISKIATDSFCNWTAYGIMSFIKNNNLRTRLCFVHLNEKDTSNLRQLLHIISDSL